MSSAIGIQVHILEVSNWSPGTRNIVIHQSLNYGNIEMLEKEWVVFLALYKYIYNTYNQGNNAKSSLPPDDWQSWSISLQRNQNSTDYFVLISLSASRMIPRCNGIRNRYFSFWCFFPHLLNFQYLTWPKRNKQSIQRDWIVKGYL